MNQFACIIPWCNRPSLRDAFLQNGEVLRSTGAEVVVVNAGGDLDQLRELIGGTMVDSLRVIHIEGAPFNKPLCLNIGVHVARAERLLLSDADILLNHAFVTEALDRAAHGSVAVARLVYETDPTACLGSLRKASRMGYPVVEQHLVTTELLLADGRSASIEYVERADAGHSAPGIMALRRSDFLQMEGANSLLTGWGFEDYDLQIRLQVVCGLKRVSLGKVWHITHPSGAARDKAESAARNRDLCIERYGKGEFLGTYSQDTREWGGRITEIAIPRPAAKTNAPHHV